MPVVIKPKPKEKSSASSKATVKMSLHLSPDTNDTLEKLADENHITKSELLRKALALIEVAFKSKEKGNHLAILDKNDKKVSEIIGL